MASIARFNPNFDVTIPGGISQLSPEKIAIIEPLLGKKFDPLSVEDQIFATFATYYSEIFKNPAIQSLAGEIQKLHQENPLSDKGLDIETQVYALFYVFISQTKPITNISEEDFSEFKKLLTIRLAREPVDQEVIDAYRNYRLLEDLKEKGILSVNDDISKDALITTSDFLSYFYDLVEEIGIPKTRLQSGSENSSPLRVPSRALTYLSQLFRKRETTRELSNGKHHTTTWCMQTVRYGLSRIYGFTLG